MNSEHLLHLRLLEQLDRLPLSESCCDICHCDCLSSHRSTESIPKEFHLDRRHSDQLKRKEKNENKNKARSKSKTIDNLSQLERTPSISSKPHSIKLPKKSKVKKVQRSKSASDLHVNSNNDTKWTIAGQDNCITIPPPPPPPRQRGVNRLRRDCEILQKLLTTSLHDKDHLVQHNNSNKKTMSSIVNNSNHESKYLTRNKNKNNIVATVDSLPSTLCDPLASLCLMPTVRRAYSQVPDHDQKILTRMVGKRVQNAAADENAWLAHKYWENERWERELLKCEQMEEYKRAIRDKQFNDYMLTKSRLANIAQRDYAQLQKLRAELDEKDSKAVERLTAVRIERDLNICQRRCEELRKVEAVVRQQGERQDEEAWQRHCIGQRLVERQRRADQLRHQQLAMQLKRLRYDNYVEQVLHDEHWRETQDNELRQREQLQMQIELKRRRTEHFVDRRRSYNAALAKTAKISASLRELVRSSVTLDAATPSSRADYPPEDNISLRHLLQRIEALPTITITEAAQTARY